MNTNPFDPGYYQEGDLRKLGFKSVGVNVQVARNCTILGLPNITFGSHVRIDGNTTIVAREGFLTIGDHVHIGGGCQLLCRKGITLDDFSGLSQGVCLYSVTDDYSGVTLTNPTVPERFKNIRSSPVFLSRHVIMGSGTVVLPGVTVGEGASVGALSLVTASLGEWGVYGGIPARKIKDRLKNLLTLESALKDEERDHE